MDNELLSILACPKCRGSLSLMRHNGKDSGLECPACALLYPIRDEIPVLLIEEALPQASQGRNSDSLIDMCGKK